jgi:hypothetical protein
MLESSSWFIAFLCVLITTPTSMHASRPRPWSALARNGCIVVIGSTFFVAAVAKSFQPSEFARDMLTLSFLPIDVRRFLPLYIPLIELCCVALLLWRRTRTLGVVVILSVLISFTAVLSWKLVMGKPPCQACFGSIRVELSAEASHKFALARNIVLISLASIALVLSPGHDRR